MLPKFRTGLFAIWEACARFGILPPHVKPVWDDNDLIAKSELLAYNQIKCLEEAGEIQKCVLVQP